MDFIMNVNWLDAALAVGLVLFTLRGALRGMMKELTSLVSLLLGIFLASYYFETVSLHLAQWISDPRLRMYAAYALIFLGVKIVITLISWIVRKVMRTANIQWIDHLLGAFVGLGNGALLGVFVISVLQLVDAQAPLLTSSLLAVHVQDISLLAAKYLPVLHP